MILVIDDSASKSVILKFGLGERYNLRLANSPNFAADILSREEIGWQSRYNAILQQADLVRFVCPSYSRDCFQRRNEWMVDRSSRVIAVYNGEPGGTRNTIEYAKAKKVECFKI